MPENRIHLRLQLVRIFWASNETKARRLLQKAIQDLLAFSSEAELQNKRGADESLTELRAGMLGTISALDSKLIPVFLQAIQTKNENTDVEDVPNQTLELVAKCHDAESAGRQIREQLAKGVVDAETIASLGIVYYKSRDKSRELTKLILEKIKRKNLLDDETAAWALHRLLAIAHNISENVKNTPTNTYKIYLELIPPQQQIELLEQYLTQRIPQTVKGLSEERLQQVKNDLREALDLAKLYPQSTIAQRVTNLQKLAEQIDPGYREARKLESSSLNELLALLPAASLENRQGLLYQAQAKITNDSDLTIFNKFLEKNSSDPKEKKQSRASSSWFALNQSVQRGDVATSIRLLDLQPSPKYQFQYLLSLLHQTYPAKDSEAIKLILSKAEIALSKLPDNYEKFEMRLQFAETIMKTDQEKSFLMLQDAGAQLAHVISSGCAYLQLKGNEGFEDDELNLNDKSDLNIWLGRYAKSLCEIAPSNLTKTMDLVELLQRQDVKIKVQSIIIGDLLDDHSLSCEEKRW